MTNLPQDTITFPTLFPEEDLSLPHDYGLSGNTGNTFEPILPSFEFQRNDVMLPQFYELVERLDTSLHISDDTTSASKTRNGCSSDSQETQVALIPQIPYRTEQVAGVYPPTVLFGPPSISSSGLPLDCVPALNNSQYFPFALVKTSSVIINFTWPAYPWIMYPIEVGVTDDYGHPLSIAELAPRFVNAARQWFEYFETNHKATHPEIGFGHSMIKGRRVGLLLSNLRLNGIVYWGSGQYLATVLRGPETYV